MLVATLGLAAHALAAPTQVPLAAPTQVPLASPPQRRGEITAWTLNPAGDAGVIRTSSHEGSTLHLLAINAQYTIPPRAAEPTQPSALYTFIANDSFVSFSPASAPEDRVVDTDWILTRTDLVYSTAPHAHPPRAGAPIELDRLEVQGTPRNLLFLSKVGMLVVLEDGHVGVQGEGGARVRMWAVDGLEGGLGAQRVAASGLGDLLIEEMVTNGTHLVFTAYNDTIRSPGTQTSAVFTFDVLHSRLVQISRDNAGHASSPIVSPSGAIAWLERREARGSALGSRRSLWLADAGAGEAPRATEVDVRVDGQELDPTSCIFWSDGRAIALLAPHNEGRAGETTDQSLFQLWTPKTPSTSASPPHVQAERIPSNGTIHSATHVGVTPLNHSHYIALKSDAARGEGTEVWVISSNPWDRPAEGYENIRLTWFD